MAAWWVFASSALGCSALFLAERMLGPGHDLRLPLAGLGAALVLLALGWRSLGGWAREPKQTERKALLGLASLAHGGVVLGAGLYALTVDGGPLPPDGDARVALRVLWPLVWTAGFAPMALLEAQLVRVGRAPRVELRRGLHFGGVGLQAALLLGWVGALNYAGSAWDASWDTRAIKDIEPSGLTRNVARAVTEPVEVALFFPPSNEVAEVVERYLRSLSKDAPALQIKRLDQERDVAEAKRLGARRNGVVVFSRSEEQRQTISLDADPDKARALLKRLDQDVQERLTRLGHSGDRVAYMVIGHGERDTRDAQGGRGLSTARGLLERMGLKVKNLGLEQGLGQGVPPDAALVVVAGPNGPLLDGERASLVRYVQGGGALWLLLDPAAEADPKLGPLLEALGLESPGGVLAHDQQFVEATHGKTDRALLYATRFANHDSLPVLSKVSGKALLLFLESTPLARAPKGPTGGGEVQLTVRSQEGTWADLDDDLDFDDGPEKRDRWGLVAAVALKPAQEGGKGGRALVVGDADVIADQTLAQSLANQQFLVDSVQWLDGLGTGGGEVAQAEDVPLVHTKGQDQLWFYGATLGAPALVLALGALLRRLLAPRRRTT